jgi:DNA-binding LytR/AlgR family response regulator
VLEQKLQGSPFRRIHRNTLVNTDHIRKMCALSSQRWLVTLNNQQELVVSKRLVNSIRSLLSV